MSRVIIKKGLLDNLAKGGYSPLNVFFRFGHHLRGKPPDKARSLEQRLQEMNKVDPELSYRVDISLPSVNVHKKQLEDRIQLLKDNRRKRDKSKLELTPIDLTKTKHQWLTTSGPTHIRDVGDHYGIYSGLFDRAYFYPRVPLDVKFTSEEVDYPVYFGNVVKPKDAQSKPFICYDSDSNTLWTLTLTNLDGNFSDQNKEYIHWMVVNIPGNNIINGETVFDYLQPFPPKGTGFHRYVFVLYKQDQKIDSSLLKPTSGNILLSRAFSSQDFYKTRQNYLTPGGLAFFQSDWDSSLHNFYHNVLDMKEPIFKYDFDPPYIKKEKWYPKREPFNLYMDKYRDSRQVNTEFLVRKLQNVHPFKPNPRPLPFPNAQYFEGYTPTWLKLEKKKSRLKWGRINDIE